MSFSDALSVGKPRSLAVAWKRRFSLWQALRIERPRLAN